MQRRPVPHEYVLVCMYPGQVVVTHVRPSSTCPRLRSCHWWTIDHEVQDHSRVINGHWTIGQTVMDKDYVDDRLRSYRCWLGSSQCIIDQVIMNGHYTLVSLRVALEYDRGLTCIDAQASCITWSMHKHHVWRDPWMYVWLPPNVCIVEGWGWRWLMVGNRFLSDL